MISKSRMRCLRRLRRDVGLLWMLSVGAELLWSPVLRANICEHTAQVQAALAAAMDVEDCREVTPAALEAVTALDLSHQALTSLSVGDFADLVRLKTLDLSHNAVTALPAGVFDPLVLLHTLRLDNNALETVPLDLFDELLLLEELTLHGNAFDSLPAGVFDGLSRFAGLDLTSGAPPPRGLAQLEAFLRTRAVESVDDFIAALPPLHKERFVMVMASHGLNAEHVSSEHPRIVSHGAAGRWLFAWLTDPAAPAASRDQVEFLHQATDAPRWTAGVIDFSGPGPTIGEPPECQTCHGALRKPLWGHLNLKRVTGWLGTEKDVPIEQILAMEGSTNPRLSPLDFRQRWRSQGGGDSAVREFSALVAWSHATVLLNKLKQEPDYESRVEEIVCAVNSLDTLQPPDLAPYFSAAARHPAYPSHTLQLIQGHPADQSLPPDSQEYQYSPYSNMDAAAVLPILHELWDNQSGIRDFFRTLSNRAIPLSHPSVPPDVNKRHLMFWQGTATVRDELLQAFRLHFGHANRASVQARRDRLAIGPPSLHLGQVKPLAKWACSILQGREPEVTLHVPPPPPPPPRPPSSRPPQRPGGGSSSDDHGDTAGRATRLSLRSDSAGSSGRINTANDVDYFRLSLPQAGVLVVETTGRTDTAGTVWQDGQQRATGETGGAGQNFRLSTQVTADPVVIAVEGQGNRTGPYTLEIRLLVGYLENPGPNSFQSGIGVISGWVCEADAVEIEIETSGGAVHRYEAGYGTARADTAQRKDGTVLCGDTDNGFGLLFNWNLLGDGVHTVVALVDEVELGRATVTVTTVGEGEEEEFLRDVAGTCVVEDFPMSGEMVTLAWQETKQNFVITSGLRPAGTNMAGVASRGYLENPGPDSFQSGIGVISGWVCEADEVEIAIETAQGAVLRYEAAYGTERADTALPRKDGTPLCGDTDNGFGLLFNWNRLGAGEHTVVALVDGEELGRATVRVTTVGEGEEEEFLRDVAGECLVEDFPMDGQTTTLVWQQTSQNFVITDVQ